MTRKQVRFEPYFIENPEDDRIPMAVAGYAVLLKPGFVLDMTQVHDWHDDSEDHVRKWGARIGKDEGINVTMRQTIDPETGNPDSMAMEVAAFGLPENRAALIRYQTRWEKGNRSFIEMEVEGPDADVSKIENAFRKKFAPPSDEDIAHLKEQMNKALEEQEWGSAQDLAQGLLVWRPDDTEVLIGLGSALIISRDIDRAEQYMNRVLELKPDSYQAHLNLGTVWMDRENYDKAIEHYQAMVDLKPDESFSPFILATAYEAKGDIQKAVELYRQAARMKKSSGPTDYPQLAEEAVERLSAQ